ncbi:lysophospholipid acyltransferase family protein [Basilea psittacipulmonis]|uniref:lysophospholipid acyltransferase family protein n=1 Tax=Basilea psittacipulmonis TaxID=1472345 RepID=UPI000A61C22B|nr:lysophospholipid acyltransferase family protein [Basilea psittacipulmonis]
MGIILFIFRAILLIVHIILGLILAGLFYPILKQQYRDSITNGWSKILLKICGVTLRIKGNPVKDNAIMWVGNHVSWIDIFAYNSVRTTYFIAKKEIQSWPIVGKLVAWVGTVFIDRGHRQAIKQVSSEINRLYEQRACVGLFPEGTTSNGYGVKPFFSSLLEVNLVHRIPLQPVAIMFYHREKRSDKFAFVGEQNLVQNLYILLKTWNVVIELVFLEPIADFPEQMTRLELAEIVRYRLEKEVYVEGVSPETHPPSVDTPPSA